MNTNNLPKNKGRLFGHLLLAVLFVLSCFSSTAQSITTTAVPYLRFAPDAISSSMGNAGLTLSPDEYSIFHNNAKALFSDKQFALGLSHMGYSTGSGSNVKGSYFMSMAGYKKSEDDKDLFSFGIRYISHGGMELSSAMGDRLGTFNPYDFDLSFGYAHKISNTLGIGVTMRGVFSNMASGVSASTGYQFSTGVALAGDVSLMYNQQFVNGNFLRGAIQFSNLSSKITYVNNAIGKDFIPTTLNVGLGYVFLFDDENDLGFEVKYSKLMIPAAPNYTGDFSQDSAAIINFRNKDVLRAWGESFNGANGLSTNYSLSFGLQYRYMNFLHIRGGYFMDKPSNVQPLNYFTVGAGVGFGRFGAQLAYQVPTGGTAANIPMMQRFKLGISFN